MYNLGEHLRDAMPFFALLIFCLVMYQVVFISRLYQKKGRAKGKITDIVRKKSDNHNGTFTYRTYVTMEYLVNGSLISQQILFLKDLPELSVGQSVDIAYDENRVYLVEIIGYQRPSSLAEILKTVIVFVSGLIFLILMPGNIVSFLLRN